MTFNTNDNIYKLNIPREYLLLKLDKYEDGKLCSAYDEMIIKLLDDGKLIGEAITLASNTDVFSSVLNWILCKRYFKIAKRYIHEYNLEKKRNKHN
mgnify:CR=1 FL=1